MGLTIVESVAFVTHYGYAIIFPIAVFEGPIISIISGFLVSLGTLNAAVVYLVLLIADVLGDSFYYALGRYGGRGLISRYGSRIGISGVQIDRLESHIQEHGPKVLLFGKTQVSGLPTGIILLIAAGIAKMRFGTFFLYNLLGSVPRILVFEAIGYYFGKTIIATNGTSFETIGTVFSIFLLCCLCGFLGLKYLERRLDS